jgi:hypothetical protein
MFAKAKNTGPLMERSAYVKSRHNGHVFCWSDSFFEHATEFENCDKYGNTDRAAWANEQLPPQHPVAPPQLAAREPSRAQHPVGIKLGVAKVNPLLSVVTDIHYETE